MLEQVSSCLDTSGKMTRNDTSSTMQSDLVLHDELLFSESSAA
jgi:hypothetical protein